VSGAAAGAQRRAEPSCIRCGGRLLPSAGRGESQVGSSQPMSIGRPSIRRRRGKSTGILEDWLLAEQRRHLQRLLTPAATAAPTSGTRRTAENLSKAPAAKIPRAKWLLMPGICAVSFGMVLLIWGWCAGRMELWQVGLPAASIGQVLLWISFRARPAAAGVQGETGMFDSPAGAT
jgi:hypothetical protein